MRVRAALFAGLFVLAVAAPAQAATFTVNTTADTAGTGCTAVACTIRGALAAAAANGNTADDVIVVPAGTYTLNPQLGSLSVQASATRITVQGAGANATIIEPPASAGVRLVSVGSNASVALERLTLRNGSAATGSGGNLLVGSMASATLTAVRVTGGRAPRGGGVAATGASALTIARSVFDSNVATGANLTDIGGGIYVEGQTMAAAVTITDSTITLNSARNGAGFGMVNNAGQPPALRGVTLARNNARAGTGIGVGGIFSQSTNARFQGSIVASNTTTINTGPAPITQPANCALATAATDEGGNVETQTDCGLAGHQNTDPQLAAALDTGAEPPVLAIPANTPAVDIAACGGRTLDQRGLSRPQGATCDAGAYEVDTAATMTITAGPTGTVNTRDAQFGFSANQPGVAPACRLAGPGQSNTFVACQKPDSHIYLGLADGAYTFSVRDGAFAGAPIVSRSFTVDATAPETTILAGPMGPTTSTSATFTFNSSEGGSTFQCALDGAAFGACPAGYTGLSQGSHTFQVRATDAAGNQDATPALRSWTVDTVAPDTTIATGPTGSVSSTSATFTFTSNEAGVNFQCALDGAGFTACPAGYTGLSQGAHVLQVRAVDAVGNFDGSPATRNWTVDIVAPDTTIATGPIGSVSSTSATFTFTSNEAGVNFQCALDGAGFTACPAGYTGLSQNQHTLLVRAVDAAGNSDASPAMRQWTVDTVAPDTTIATGPTGSVSSTSATFTLTSNEAGVNFQCALDGAGFAACPAGYTGLSQNQHTLLVRAVDAAGNSDSSPAMRQWTVDTVAPNTTLTPITTPTSDQTPTFTFASEPGATFQCRVDAVAFALCTSPHTTAALGDGPHTFEVRAVDAAGNVDGSPGAQSFVVDAGVPDTTIESGPAGAINDSTPTFTFSSDEAGALFSCSFDGAKPAPCTSPFTPAALAEGAHTFAVRARDASGNVDASPATRAFTVDVTPPAAPEVVSGPGGPTTDPAPAFTFAATDTVTCRLEGPVTREFETCASPKSFGALPPGDYVFVVRSVDAAGNANETRRAFSVTTPQQAQPTPTPDPSPTPTPTPTPSATRVVVAPAAGTISVRLPGARTFGPLDVTKDIPFGSEVDTRKGRVTLTALPTAGKPPETADFYDGLFTVHKVGGFIELRLSEKLTGCPKARKSTASAAQKKPKSRKLWGSGKGKFRTRGQYSAATVRGTTWLVQDTCTTTLTRVTQGVVAVNDFAKRKTVLVKKGKRYTARPKRR